MAADYSHLRVITAAKIEASITHGARRPPSKAEPYPGRPTDEALLEAVERLEPPLLSPELLTLLRKQLDPGAQRRGRPRRGPRDIDRLISALGSIARSDVPPLFLKALKQRLVSGKRFREFDRGLPMYRWRQREDAAHLIRGIYYLLLELVQANPTGPVHHEILGELAVPGEARGPAGAALLMTRQILVKWQHHPPSLARMRNIISERNSLRFS